MQDGDEEHMSIGHHIGKCSHFYSDFQVSSSLHFLVPGLIYLVYFVILGDRTHVIEKKRDKDGNVRKQQKFVNLDEGMFITNRIIFYSINLS